MANTLQKLRPDRDLRCYFQMPTSVAALSSTSPTGFTLSGNWRQQFDWAVIEWNRDNVFEHPLLRNLPDGDLSGIHLAYQETRTNCIGIDSKLFPTVAWPYLRIWADPGSGEQLYLIDLARYAVPTQGSYTAASATFTLSGTVLPADYFELAWNEEHYGYTAVPGDTSITVCSALAGIIDSFPTTMQASASGSQLAISYSRNSATNSGSNGNRVGAYGNAKSAGASWQQWYQTLSGGKSPTVWQINLDFTSLRDYVTNPGNPSGTPVPTSGVRKMRWTYAADTQIGSYQQTEFAVTVSNWTVSGTNLAYSVAGSGSRRIENDDPQVQYAGSWQKSPVGNYSGGTIQFTSTQGASLTCSYSHPVAHTAYLGTRYAASCGTISVVVDGSPPRTINLNPGGDDVLCRISLGPLAAQQTHTVQIQKVDTTGPYVYFDFLEITVPTQTLPTVPANPKTTLATDWDTEHCLALAPERTAWLINTLGFCGRANHYAGALWFFQMARLGQVYASATVTFVGTPSANFGTTLMIGGSPITHLQLSGDGAPSVAKAFELLINNGYTAIWASASATTLTIQSRTMGSVGNNIPLSASTNQPSGFTVTVSSPTLTGGVDGIAAGSPYMDIADQPGLPGTLGWRVDINATPRINRAARDWTTSYFAALTGYGISMTAAFSTELQFGDPSLSAGIAQRYPDGTAVFVNTPAVQTNFSPASLNYWQGVYSGMAQIMVAAGVTPYLQFGEIQWWYFPNASGMTFYDAFTTRTFQQLYGHAMSTITSNNALPSAFPQEAIFLPQQIGNFTSAIQSYVTQGFSNALFEVLYPPDVNNFAFTKVVNLPSAAWTSSSLRCMKTENFTYTANRNLDLANQSIGLPAQLGFPHNQASHLVGVGDPTTPWTKEAGLGYAANLESVVLFALDQFCLIGYGFPIQSGYHHSAFLG